MKNCQAKFVFNTMVANEAHCVTRMLESVYRYVDYWVIQDNGSKDGTQEIVQNFFKEKNIPGFLYEIPWSGCMGYNRDHTVQTCLQANHGCDWILRVDADEVLEVDDSFDWKIFDDTSIQAFDVPALLGINKFFRCWLWNARLPWKFKHDKRHECVYLDQEGVGENFQRVPLPFTFRHNLVSTGRTSMNPYKYYMDALEIEKELLVNDTMTTDSYHLYYIGKSYHDNIPTDKLPFGNDHNLELARRGIFFFNKFLDVKHNFSETGTPRHIDEMAYTACLWLSRLYELAGDTYNRIEILKKAEAFCPARNEHLKRLASIYQHLKQYPQMLEITTKWIQPERVNPFPHFGVFVEEDSYHDTSTIPHQVHKEACALNGQ